MSIDKKLTYIVEERKRSTPLVLGHLDQFLTLAQCHGITLVNYDVPITSVILNEMLKGVRKISPELFCAIYARLEFECNHGVSYPFLLMTDIALSPPSVWMLRMMLTTMKAPVEEPPKPIKAQVILSATSDKSDPSTYIDVEKAHKYVLEKYHERVQDVKKIISAFSRIYGLTQIIAPNDGAGVAYAACKMLDIPCISSDPSLPMCLEASKLGNIVTHKVGSDLCKEPGTVFISHSESLDPGLVTCALYHKRHVIVYESVEIYPGYSLLYDNGSNIRSTFEVNLPLVLSSIPYPRKLHDWYDMTQHGSEFYVSDHEVIHHLTHFAAHKVRIAVSTTNPKVIELLAVYKIPYIPPANHHIGVYLTKIDRECPRYFSLEAGKFHEYLEHFAYVGDFTYVYALKGKKQVMLGHRTYGVFRGTLEGIDEFGVKALVSSIRPRMSCLSPSHLDPTPLELLHEKCKNSMIIAQLTPSEHEYTTRQAFFKTSGGVIKSIVPWRPVKLDSLPLTLRHRPNVNYTWQSGPTHFKIDSHEWDIEKGGYYWDGKKVDLSFIERYYGAHDRHIFPLHRSIDKSIVHRVATSKAHDFFSDGVAEYVVSEEKMRIKRNTTILLEAITQYPEYMVWYYEQLIFRGTSATTDIASVLGSGPRNLKNSGGILKNIRDDSGGTTTFTTSVSSPKR